MVGIRTMSESTINSKQCGMTCLQEKRATVINEGSDCCTNDRGGAPPTPYQVGMGAPLLGLRDHGGGRAGVEGLGGGPPRRDSYTIEQVPRSRTWDYSESRR